MLLGKKTTMACVDLEGSWGACLTFCHKNIVHVCLVLEVLRSAHYGLAFLEILDLLPYWIALLGNIQVTSRVLMLS